MAADPVTPSSSAGESRSISSSSSSSTWKWFSNNSSRLVPLDRAEPGDWINDWKRTFSLSSELAAMLDPFPGDEFQKPESEIHQ